MRIERNEGCLRFQIAFRINRVQMIELSFQCLFCSLLQIEIACPVPQAG